MLDFKKGNNEQKLKVTKELEKFWYSQKNKIEEGYSAVMLSLLSRFFIELNDIAKAEYYLNEYEKNKDVIRNNHTEIEQGSMCSGLQSLFCLKFMIILRNLYHNKLLLIFMLML